MTLTETDDVGARAAGRDYALIGTASELTLFAAADLTVEKSETKLPAITMPTSGQFELGDELVLKVPARVARVIFDVNGNRLHVLEADEFERLNGGDE
jgi:hypothetical protein